MKCPLLGLDEQNREWAHKAKQADCLKEECAWWDKVEERCAILTITTNLDALASVLSLIENKMPRAEQ